MKTLKVILFVALIVATYTGVYLFNRSPETKQTWFNNWVCYTWCTSIWKGVVNAIVAWDQAWSCNYTWEEQERCIAEKEQIKQ